MIKDDDIQKIILKKHFGYDDFRPGQLNIIRSITSKKDTLAILPTGGGKSICYQIPALNFKGITLVISPLISLMQDQVEALHRREIPCTYINSSLDRMKMKLRLQQIKALEHKIIYAAPERLSSKIFQKFAKELNIDLIAIDEAHCVSQWGHDFRPAYLKIGEFVCTLKKRPVMAAFTATATKKVQNDMIKQLGLTSPRKFLGSFNRTNLEIRIKRTDEMLKAKELLKSLEDMTGEGVDIIFCQTRLMVEEIYYRISEAGYKAAYYHAGLSSSQREKIQKGFMNNEFEIIVCTNAFGMGIDKPDVRRVYHFGIPSNIENYYQEIGRAGRDGEQSKCFLFYSVNDIRQKQYHVKQKIEKLLEERGNNKETRTICKWNEERLKAVLDFLITDTCRKKFILKYFSEGLKEPCNNCDNCMQ